MTETAIAPDSTFEINAEVTVAELGGETVLLHTGRAAYFGLDEIGTQIWGGIGQGLNVAQICDGIAGQTGQSRAVVEGDAVELLRDMMANSIIGLCSA